MTDEVRFELKTLTIRIPMRLARRGGRKLILTPDGAAPAPAPAPQRPLPDDTMVKALVRAHRWRRKIESGEAASITEVAEQEGVTAPYVYRLLRLTCLAPDIVAAILDGRQPKGIALADLVREVPLNWSEQGSLFGNAPRGLIDLRMRVDIRACKFMVADLTDENRGAYWEAGFAEGLGRHVFYTCEAAKFERAKTHFDTEHLLTIKWSLDRLAATTDELKAAIRNTFPADAKQVD